ncbi:MAG: hypothetical protein WC876_08755 [Candidatus Thermoplasmatota archaeon]
MQDGIGRGGYRVLAFVFFGVGALGMAMAAVALTPAGFFEWLGLALGAVALAALTGLTFATLSAPAFTAPSSFRPAPAGAQDHGVVPLPTPELPVDSDPSADIGFEYGDAGQAPTAPMGPPRIQPPPVPVVQPRRTPTDTKGWPERTGPSGVTRRQVTERDLPRDPGPEIEVDGPVPAKPRREANIVMARTVASAEATGIPEGTGVGKCSNCGVLLLAPKRRPIRLQCPRCERVHTLA